MTDHDHMQRTQLRSDGWRFCGNRSARKHRRQGHEVRWFPGNGYGWRTRNG